MGKRILVFLKPTWLLIPAIFTGVSEIFKWWGINKMPPHWLFWLLLIIGIVIAILLTNNELKKKGEESKDKNKFTKQEALEIASRFTTLMTQILSAQTQDDMAKIQTQVRNEWIKCPDKGLAKEMDICIKAV